jgi:glycosyltransferase involved in cell wall biosynthesis
MYNIADCTINISDAEGFGLATLESLACETPILVNMTGGLQEQVTDGKEWFGIGLEPASKAIIGSQQVPYIYEDRVSKEDFIQALRDIFNMTPGQRKLLGHKGKQHVVTNYNFENYQKQWIKMMDSIIEKYGSWENRKFYKPWAFSEITK